MQIISDSVSDGSVLRVKYKDSISYRNPAKSGRSGLKSPNGATRNASMTITKRILRTVRHLTIGGSASTEGTSVTAILASLKEQKHLNYTDILLAKILKHATILGNVLGLILM